MLVAINTKYRYNKKRDEGKLSTDWHIKDLSHEKLEKHLLKGYPIANIYNKGITGFRRTKVHFSSATFIAMDFDNNPKKLKEYNAKEFTVAELTAGYSKRAKFIKEHGYIGYLTYNHTRENNRFRIIFKLPKPITDLNKYKKIYKAFLNKFPSADHDYIISSGFVWGAKKNTSSLKLANELSIEVLRGVLAQNKPKENNKVKRSINKLSNCIKDQDELFHVLVNKQLNQLRNAIPGSRMTTLNEICYSIGGLIANLELCQTDEENIKTEIKKIAYELGAITNFESFTKNDINKTIKKSLKDGEKKPLDFIEITAKKYRLFKNQQKKGCFQYPQQISTNYPSPEYISKITDQEIYEAETTQIANFGKFSIRDDKIIQKTLIIDIFDILKNTEASRYYLALWEYANIKNTLNFNEIEINEIIKIAHPILSKQEMYRQRKKFKNCIKKLFTITLFRITKKDDIELEEGIHLIEKLSFVTKRNHSFISYKLPNTFGKFGSYLPFNLKLLSGNDKGAFNLAIALSKEAFRINGFELLKIGSRDFTPPENFIPIEWPIDRVLKEIRTITTKNATERNRLLNNTLTKLKRVKIIDRYTIRNKRIEIYFKK